MPRYLRQYVFFVQIQDYDMLEKKVKSVVENYPEFHLTEGKMVGG